MTLADVSPLFTTYFNAAAEVTSHAPGRVNLIGEHTDYNEGFVFPAAINCGTAIAAARRDDGIIRVVAVDYDNACAEFSLDNIEHQPQPGWLNYVKGVCQVVRARYPQLGGANLVVTGNVPQGAEVPILSQDKLDRKNLCHHLPPRYSRTAFDDQSV